MKKSLSIAAGLILLFLCIILFSMLGKNDQQTEEITIGVAVYNLDDAEVREFRDYLENYIGVTFDVDFLYSSSILTEEEEISFINELHEKDVKGVISFLSTDLEQVLPTCDEYGMYYIRGSGTISDSMYEKVKEDSYFLGTIGPSVESESETAEEMAEYFASKDAQQQNHYILACGGAGIGNEMHRLRAMGILEKLQEVYGLTYEKDPEELVQTEEISQIETGTDVTITLLPGYASTDNLAEKLSDLLNTGDYNAVLSVLSVNNLIDVISEAEEKNSQDILVGAIDCYTEDTYQLFNTKGYGNTPKLDYLVGKYGAIVAPSFVAMMNAYDGFAENYREDGYAFRLEQSFWTASSKEEFNEQYALSKSTYDNIYSAVDMMKVMKSYTSDADFEAFKQFTEK